MSGGKTRHNAGGFPEKHIPAARLTGFEFYRQKDIAMADDADCALMQWDGWTKGTACNIRDLRKIGKKVRIIMYRSKR